MKMIFRVLALVLAATLVAACGFHKSGPVPVLGIVLQFDGDKLVDAAVVGKAADMAECREKEAALAKANPLPEGFKLACAPLEVQ